MGTMTGHLSGKVGLGVRPVVDFSGPVGGACTLSKSNCSSLHEHRSGPGPGELTRGTHSHDWP